MLSFSHHRSIDLGPLAPFSCAWHLLLLLIVLFLPKELAIHTAAGKEEQVQKFKTSMKVTHMYHIKLALQYLSTLDLAERVVQTALYSIQRLICTAIIYQDTVRNPEEMISTNKKSFTASPLFHSLRTSPSCRFLWYKVRFHCEWQFPTNLAFLSVLIKSWDEKAEVEPDRNCTLRLLWLRVCSPHTWRFSPESTTSGAELLYYTPSATLGVYKMHRET